MRDHSPEAAEPGRQPATGMVTTDLQVDGSGTLADDQRQPARDGEPRVAAEGTLAGRLRDTAERARRYFESARAPATVRAYASDLADFETWCAVGAGGLSTLPATPEAVALYIADLAEG